MKLDLEAFNWYGVDHMVMRKEYGDLDGNLEYVGSFCLVGSDSPIAWYRSPNPDRSKGHKDYVGYGERTVLDFGVPYMKQAYIFGLDAAEMDQHRTQPGMYCSECDQVLYSVTRHDARWCRCRKVMVDGGRDYLRCTLEGVRVVIDHLTSQVSE